MSSTFLACWYWLLALSLQVDFQHLYPDSRAIVVAKIVLQLSSVPTVSFVSLLRSTIESEATPVSSFHLQGILKDSNLVVKQQVAFEAESDRAVLVIQTWIQQCLGFVTYAVGGTHVLARSYHVTPPSCGHLDTEFQVGRIRSRFLNTSISYSFRYPLLSL